MKILNSVKILLILVVTLGFMSCGDDNYYLIQNSDDKLCKYIWVDETDRESYSLQFFLKGNRGNEITITYSEDGKNRLEREFTWNWTDSSKEALKIIFSGGKVTTLENVWVREHYMLGELNGEIISFKGKEEL